MRIAREGLPFVGAGILLLVTLGVLAGTFSRWFWIAFALCLPVAAWVPYFFRDPVRSGKRGTELVLSPADGKVVVIDDVKEPDFVQGPARRVAIFMNVFNVHVNRYPTEGTVAYRNYRKGRFLNATLDKSSEQNEKMSLGVDSPRGPILVHQIAGLIARRIVTDHQPGTEVRQGQRLGLIRFGSRVEILLPTDVHVQVAVGQQVKAGQTVIGEWTE